MNSDLISRSALCEEYEDYLMVCDSGGLNTAHEMLEAAREFPAVDAVEVVRCRDCIYWKPRHVRLDDGTERDYLPGEDYVDVSVGINVGSQCRVDCGKGFGYTFRADGDFCSRGRRKMDGDVNENSKA